MTQSPPYAMSTPHRVSRKRCGTRHCHRQVRAMRWLFNSSSRGMGMQDDTGDLKVAARVGTLFYAYLQSRKSARRWQFEEERYAAFLEALKTEYRCTHPLLLLRRIRLSVGKAPLPWYLLGAARGSELRYLGSLEPRLRKGRFMQCAKDALRREIHYEVDADTKRARDYWRHYRQQEGTRIQIDVPTPGYRTGRRIFNSKLLKEQLEAKWTHPNKQERGTD